MAFSISRLRFYLAFLLLLSSSSLNLTHAHEISDHHHHDQLPIQHQNQDGPDAIPIPYSTRAHWMRRAVMALDQLRGSPCPVQAFGTAVVNHTGHGPGDLICIGVNENEQTGNPTLHGKSHEDPRFHVLCRRSEDAVDTARDQTHPSRRRGSKGQKVKGESDVLAGEIAAINNCSALLSRPPYGLSPSEVRSAFRSFSLYTTAEACPMCAAAIRWSGFREYIYSTSIERLHELNWNQFYIDSEEVFRRSGKLCPPTGLIGGVLANETEGLFAWQWASGSCPEGCVRKEGWCGKEE